jgi:integrase
MLVFGRIELHEVDVPDIPAGFKVYEITHGSRYRLNRPIRIRLPSERDKATEDAYRYIIKGLIDWCPSLTPFACESSSILELAKRLRRHQSSSTNTLRNYIYGIHQFSKFVEMKPDELIAECKNNGGSLATLEKHSKLIDDFIGALTADGLAPCTIGSYIKGVKALYEACRLPLSIERIRKRVKYEDRAPTQEQLTKLLDFADIRLRDKLIIAILATSGLRIGTLAQLKYRHVKHDLERGMVPLHIHIESELTKGEYGSYDTFINKETVALLKADLKRRRQGSVKRSPDALFEEYEKRVEAGETPKKVRDELRLKGLPPEKIHDESPLIRNMHDVIPKPLTPKQISNRIRSLYIKAGLVQKSDRVRYPIRAHSIRKFFRTRLAELGMNTDYIEYMMGHKISTYHDVKGLGVERLRAEYAKANLTIRPQPKPSKIEQLKELARIWGISEGELAKAFSRPHRVEVVGGRVVSEEEQQMEILRDLLKEAMKKELLKMKNEG